MRAVVFDAPGSVDVLEVRDVADPQPAPGELLVRVFATALNRADLLQRRGLYPPPPGASDILGLEFAGEVAKVGSAVEGFAVGDAIFGLLAGGGYAEFVTIDPRMAIPLPDDLSFDAAAAVPEAFFTADENLFTLAGLQRGERVLVHAGASGVGSAAIQLARRAGARVAATVGSAEKARLASELGAELVVNYREEDFARRVLDEWGSEGVDVILDLVGASHGAGNAKVLGTGGRWLVVGLVGGSRLELDLARVLMKRQRLIGNAIRGQSQGEKVRMTERFREHVLPGFESGELRPVLDRVYPLEDVRDAHRRMEANENLGKIVLRL